jgi:hypothetical protein
VADDRLVARHPSERLSGRRERNDYADLDYASIADVLGVEVGYAVPLARRAAVTGLTGIDAGGREAAQLKVGRLSR